MAFRRPFKGLLRFWWNPSAEVNQGWPQAMARLGRTAGQARPAISLFVCPPSFSFWFLFFVFLFWWQDGRPGPARHPPQSTLIYVTVLNSPPTQAYLQAYPLHDSQTIEKKDYGDAIVSWDLIPSMELLRMIISYGKQVKVKEPNWLMQKIEKLKWVEIKHSFKN